MLNFCCSSKEKRPPNILTSAGERSACPLCCPWQHNTPSLPACLPVCLFCLTLICLSCSFSPSLSSVSLFHLSSQSPPLLCLSLFLSFLLIVLWPFIFVLTGEAFNDNEGAWKQRQSDYIWIRLHLQPLLPCDLIALTAATRMKIALLYYFVPFSSEHIGLCVCACTCMGAAARAPRSAADREVREMKVEGW